MVEKVIVNPAGVRCLGNIVSPKLLSDYNKYFSKITSGTDTVDGDTRTVYTSEYITGSKLTVTAPRLVSVGTQTFTVTATLKNSSNTVITGASLTCIINNEITYTGTTNSSGVCSFTVDVEEYVDDYRIRVIYDGTNSISGCFFNQRTYVVDVDEITLTANKGITKTDEDVYLIGTLTGTGVTGETIPVPFQTLNFYEEYTPSLRLKTPSLLQDDDSVSLVTSVHDAEDGSSVKISSQIVDYYVWNDNLFYVGGTSSDSDEDSFVFNSSYLTETVGATGTTVSATGESANSNYSANLYNTTTTTLTDFIGDCVVEFDILSVSSNSVLRLTDTNNVYSTDNLETGHYRIEYTNKTAHTFKDGVEVGDGTAMDFDGFYAIQFRLGRNSSLTYKNFKIGGF